ncbi:hypothetical protein HW423_09575 [Aerococcaceae bacterium INB8]|uniref:SnoaL-like domain-containing protein n=1 Tax=Ruoffia halotolerans TaxID=2748684 RepID=A0A839A7R7_9LACT|nr:hypothetical protein [Ruoffia halotolerans]MBA5730032.1 hypothetical protein [Ruoffia halotolerans]
MSKQIRKYIVWFIGIGLLAVLLFFMTMSNANNIHTSQEENRKLEAEIQAIYQRNLQGANTEDVDLYLSTINTKAREETGEVMAQFFTDFDVRQDLLEFEVTDIEPDAIVAKARQKAVGESVLEEETYRNHIATVLVVFKQEEGEWRISESSITNIEFTP